jgi:hypothetical protein
MKYTAIILLTLMIAIPTFAQEPTLEYGEPTTGEISNREFEIEYSFIGATGDVVIISLVPEDTTRGLTTPALLLLDADFNVLTSVDASFSPAILVFDISEDATYIVLATRRGGRSGDSEGKFTLTVSKAQLLTPGEIVEVSATSESPTYFAVRSSEAFDVNYTRQRGDFYPEISVNIIKETLFGDSNLTSIASVTGDRLERASIGIDPTGAEELFIVEIGEPLFQINFREKRVVFSLELSN